MKVNILKITAVLLLLVGSFFACTTKNEIPEEEDCLCYGEVPYMPCNCEEGVSMQPIVIGGSNFVLQGEAYLFLDSVPKDFYPPEFLLIDDESYLQVYYIVYDSEMNLGCLITHGFMSFGIDRICNFPDFVKEWDIPVEGIKVCFSGIMYESCVRRIPHLICCGIDATSVGGFYFIIDFILINLKKM